MLKPRRLALSGPLFSRSTATSRASRQRSRRRWLRRALLLLVLLGAWRMVAPVRWLQGRIAQDQAALRVRPTSFRIGARERVMIVSPHLDDETLGAGGLIAHLSNRKIPLRVVFLTNGDGSMSTVLALNFQHARRFSFVESALLRQREALAALKKLGVNKGQVVFLGYPDGDLQTLWDGWNNPAPIRSRFTHLTAVPYANAPGAGSEFRARNLLRDLQGEIATFRPTRLVSTLGSDSHPDHWSADAFSRLALQVLAARSAAPTRVARSVEHDGFVIHHGLFPLPHGFRPNARLNVPSALLRGGAKQTMWRDFALSASERESKRAALEEYRSQLTWTPLYLRGFVRQNEPLGRAHDFAPNNPPGSSSDSLSAAWSDEKSESWALAQRPAADIVGLDIQTRRKPLQAEIMLAAPLQAGVRHTLNIKAIAEDGHVLARRFELRLGSRGSVRDEMQASEANLGGQIPVVRTRGGFVVKLDRSALGFAGQSKPRSLVVDASTSGVEDAPGTPALDRTETRAIGFQ